MGEKKAVIIGSGFGGLAAAGLLARDDFNVKVFEKNEQAGGRASVWMKDGFKFDMGPSWYLMPDIFDNYFSEFGKKPEDFMDLKRLNPSYRVFFDKDDIIDIYSDLDKNLETFEKLEKGAKQKFKDYLSTSKYQYDIAMKDFIYKDYKHLYEFFKPKLLVEGTKLHMFSKLDDYAKRFFESEKIRKILEYTIVFLGGSPYKSPALYSLMSHVDFNMGVWYPVGGIGKLVEAMKKVAELQGAEFNFNQAVTKIKSEGGVVKGVETEKGSYDADVVICNADMPYAEMNLLEKKYESYNNNYWDKRKMAPSAYLLFIGLDKNLDGVLHHNLYFDPSWERHFSEIFDKPVWPDNPSYYVSATSKTDKTVSPKGCENLFILVPVAAGLEDTKKIREKYYNKTLKHLEKLIGQDIIDSVKLKRIFAHNDFIERYHAYKGTALGLAHTLKQTAVFRPKHESKKVKNLYYTGHYNHPGIGVPMVIISSQIISNIIKKKI